MRFIGVVFSACGAAALVTGCSVGGGQSAEEGEPVTSAVQAESELMGEVGSPAAFHFDSGDLVIGPFDPEEVKDDLFDPCAEISDAELAEVGLAKSEVQPDQGVLPVMSSKYCGITVDDPYQSRAIAVIPAPKAEILKKVQVLPGFPVENVPGALVVPPYPEANDTCYAIVETVRGTLATLTSSLRDDASLEQLCPTSVSMLESLY